jgi:hypothetical protein
LVGQLIHCRHGLQLNQLRRLGGGPPRLILGQSGSLHTAVSRSFRIGLRDSD